MRRTVISTALALALASSALAPAFAHCQIPCGIYGDMTRIDLLREDITTVEKSMTQIVDLSKDAAANMNQIVRWITNKDEHCDKIQEMVSQYWMTQRVKPVAASDEAAYRKYTAQIAMLHAMLVSAMKAKQTTDLTHVQGLRKQVDAFAESYFSKEDLEHLKTQHH